MRSYIILIMVILGLSFTACNSDNISAQLPSHTTVPYTITPTALLEKIVVLSTNTETPSPPTQTTTQIPTPLFVPAQTLMQTSTTTMTPTDTKNLTPYAPSPVPTSTDELFPDQLLPDLQTLPPTDIRLLYNPDTGRALIRFTNSIWNSGPGQLELIGVPNQANDQIRVSQRVFAADPDIFDEYEVGEFKFNDPHDHWHLEQFASYEVWSLDENGSLETMVSSGGKVSWCVIDESLAETALPDDMISTSPNYFNCEGKIQGLSVGWVDIYEYYLPRQWVEIAPLEDGLYVLVSTVNPDHLLYEEDFHNNSALVFFEIRELSLKLLEDIFFED